MTSKLNIVNLNSLNFKNNDAPQTDRKNVRPSAFLNSIDLQPLNYYAPVKIAGNRFTKQSYNLAKKARQSIDPLGDIFLPRIDEKPRDTRIPGLKYSHSPEGKYSKNDSLFSQIFEMNSDENRRVKTEIDEQNEKIERLLKFRDKKATMVSILQIIGKNNKVEQINLDDNEARPKRKIKRQQTNGRMLKYDP